MTKTKQYNSQCQYSSSNICCLNNTVKCIQSACGYFSSSISRVRAICCVGIYYSAGSRPGTSRKMVALRSSWFQSLPQRWFPSLICGSRISSCVLLRSLAKWLRLCLFSLFSVGTVSFLWSGWPGSLRIFSVWVRNLHVLWSSRGSRSALVSISLMGIIFMAPTMALMRHFGLCQACSCWQLKRWPRRLWHTPEWDRLLPCRLFPGCLCQLPRLRPPVSLGDPPFSQILPKAITQLLAFSCSWGLEWRSKLFRIYQKSVGTINAPGLLESDFKMINTS